MKHLAAPDFWDCMDKLPETVQKQASNAFNLLKINPRHPSLSLKKIDKFRSVRIGLHYRALAVEVDDALLWFWIGSHSDYDQLIAKL